MTTEDRWKGLQLVDQDQVPELPGREEEGVTLLERHRRAEFGLVVVVAEVSDLVEVAAESKRVVNTFLDVLSLETQA